MIFFSHIRSSYFLAWEFFLFWFGQLFFICSHFPLTFIAALRGFRLATADHSGPRGLFLIRAVVVIGMVVVVDVDAKVLLIVVVTALTPSAE